MKSLSESLFDAGLAEKDLRFGDIYKPTEVLYRDAEDIKKIGNHLIMSKLKKGSKPLNLNGVDGYDRFKTPLDYLPYVLGEIAELPLEEKFLNTKDDANYLSYEWKMMDMFAKYQRSNTNKVWFSMKVYDWNPELQILVSNMTGYWSISIKYEKK